METIATLSTKGQLTLPVSARRAMRLQTGDKVVVKYNPKSQTVTLAKPLTIEELSQKISKYIKPGTKPVLNVDKHYQKHRGETIR